MQVDKLFLFFFNLKKKIMRHIFSFNKKVLSLPFKKIFAFSVSLQFLIRDKHMINNSIQTENIERLIQPMPTQVDLPQAAPFFLLSLFPLS